MKIKLLVLVIGIGLILYHFIPIIYYPKSSGKYGVGNVMIHMKKENQEFNVHVLYPTNSTSDKQYPLQKIKVVQDALSRDSYIQKWLWHIALYNVKTYMQPNVLISHDQSSFPVIIYLPGIAGTGLDFYYPSELASHGYTVFSIEPPGDSMVMEFSDGRRIFLNKDLHKAQQENNREKIYQYRNQAHERWNQYILLLIDWLKEENQNPQSKFYKKLDLNRLVVMGHSHGGAVALDFCQKHSKLCKVGINMDGWTKTYNISNLFTTSFLFMLSKNGHMPEMDSLFQNNQRSNFKKITIQNAGHGAFTDTVLLKYPIVQLMGDVFGNSVKVRQEIISEILTFLKQYL